MTEQTYAIAGLGELIWDLLPGGKQLGGAPANFAYISHLLGAEAVVASRVGRDELGSLARRRLAQRGIATGYLQDDAEHPTGTVDVRVDEQGEALFQVNTNSAWDYLAWTPQWAELAGRVDAVCFGTLGQRAPPARAVIQRFLRRMRPESLRLFDVNLRHSFFTAGMLAASLAQTTVVKLNSDELPLVAQMLALPGGSERKVAESLLEAFQLQLVAVTRGARGSLLVTAQEASEHAGRRARVADTIGAGDAFAATLAHGWLRGAALERIGAAANRMGAWVVTQTGATPPPDTELIEAVRRDLRVGA